MQKQYVICSRFPGSPQAKVFAVISCHILHFSAAKSRLTYEVPCHPSPHSPYIMANLNFYHVYKQTIRASSSSSSLEGRKESPPAIVAVAAVVDARKTSHNICISISYAVKKIHMLPRLLLGKKEKNFPLLH